jgi:hypothetical protein
MGQKRTSMHNPTVSAVAPVAVPRTYLISRGFAAYSVGFCLVWFGAIVGELNPMINCSPKGSPPNQRSRGDRG